jgi:type I protein arginine methyltransferase
MSAFAKIAGGGIDLALSLRREIARHPATRDLYRELANRNLFNDLYLHDRMLADGVRVEAYRRAIAKHVKPGDVVLDLGTGSGLLALLAAKAGAAKVYAIDHGLWVDAARAVAEDNGLTNIDFQRVNSRRFNCPEKIDILLQEQIGDALFEEQMIANVVDLRDRLLKPGGLILPARFELFVDPVQLREPRSFAWQQEIAGIRFSALRELSEQQPATYRFKPLPPSDYDHFLTRSEAVLSFDLNTVRAVEDLPGVIAYQRVVTAAGRLDGFCLHFKAGFDDELAFDSSPFGKPTSWRNPLLRIPSRDCAAGELITLRLEAADWTDPTTWKW